MKTLKSFRLISSIFSFILMITSTFSLSVNLTEYFNTGPFSEAIFWFLFLTVMASCTSFLVELFSILKDSDMVTSNVFRFVSALIFLALIIWSFVALYLSGKSFYDLNKFQIFDFVVFMIAAFTRIITEFVLRFKLIIVLEKKKISRERIIEFNQKHFDPNNPWT